MTFKLQLRGISWFSGAKCLPCAPLSYGIIRVWAGEAIKFHWLYEVFHGVKDIQSLYSPQSFLPFLVNKHDSKCFQYAATAALNHNEIGKRSEFSKLSLLYVNIIGKE